jgi:hypothetical protein
MKLYAKEETGVVEKRRERGKGRSHLIIVINTNLKTGLWP